MRRRGKLQEVKFSAPPMDVWRTVSKTQRDESAKKREKM